jgi:hypothetical protein
MAGSTMTFSRPAAVVSSAAPVDPGWDEAFLRVEGYLRAHHLESRVLLNRIVTEIIQDARTLAQGSPSEEPVKLAMQATHARIGAWFARAGMDLDWTNERMRARGRLAMVLADLPGRWSNLFLSADPLPEEFAAAMRSFALFPSPRLQLSSMPPAPLEFAYNDGSPSPPNRNVRLLLRAFGSWLLIAGFFGIAWAASH